MVTTGARGCSVAGSSFDVEQAFLDVGLGDAAHRVAELFGEKLRGIGVDRVGDLRHVTLLHQDLDHVDAALRHAVREFLDGHRLRNDDFARQLFLVFGVAMPGHALRAAAERSDRTLAHIVGAERRHQRQAPALLRRAGTRRLGRGCGTRRRAAARTASGTAIVLLGFGGQLSGDGRAAGLQPRGLFLAAEAFLGDFVGPALGLFVVTAALILGALARFGGFTFGALDRFARLADLRLFLGDLALFGLAHLGIAERMRAAALLFLGERTKNDAGRLRRDWRGGSGVAAGAGAAGPRATTPPRRATGCTAGAASAGFASPGPTVRLRTFSTTTALERPWLKLWRTTPVSARGFSVSVVFEADAQRLLAGTFRISSHSHPILNCG